MELRRWRVSRPSSSHFCKSGMTYQKLGTPLWKPGRSNSMTWSSFNQGLSYEVANCGYFHRRYFNRRCFNRRYDVKSELRDLGKNWRQMSSNQLLYGGIWTELSTPRLTWKRQVGSDWNDYIDSQSNRLKISKIPGQTHLKLNNFKLLLCCVSKVWSELILFVIFEFSYLFLF